MTRDEHDAAITTLLRADPTERTADLAARTGLHRATVARFRKRLETGWATAVAWRPCPACGDPVPQPAGNPHPKYHDACHRAHWNRVRQERDAADPERRARNVRRVAAWRERNPDRLDVNRQRFTAARRERLRALPEESFEERITALRDPDYNVMAQERTKTLARQHHELWTADEDAVLIERYREPVKALALELGRTYYATAARIHRLRKRGLIPAEED